MQQRAMVNNTSLAPPAVPWRSVKLCKKWRLQACSVNAALALRLKRAQKPYIRGSLNPKTSKKESLEPEGTP